jgi:predicted nucleic acid-binding protein
VRRPTPIIVLDAAVLVAAAFGRVDAIINVQRRVAVVAAERVLEEARGRIVLGAKRPDLLGKLEALTAALTIVPDAELDSLVPACEMALREAVASRNGSIRDAHVLALAWAADADVWTTDRDFAGTGVASWSTPNLMRALAEPA